MGYTYKQKFNRKYGFKLNEPHSLEEIAKITKYKLSGIKMVFEKGEGAFESNPQSVRKGMTKAGWAYSRIYASVDPTSKSHKIDKVHLKKNI